MAWLKSSERGAVLKDHTLPIRQKTPHRSRPLSQSATDVEIRGVIALRLHSPCDDRLLCERPDLGIVVAFQMAR